ncbi:LANO_0G15170g1_1 [Lachancea nothofagi CBS 11611]|uniref:N-acetyltransferase ECO1 n=1 Tax=Lachancea nothofagi CBS 11611 TaxID=1266666 RepID=A0A1G4KK69_9SACH|nr:LANO_0G15170g1_1 [Lachancea nothofagi CBS 11611]
MARAGRQSHSTPKSSKRKQSILSFGDEKRQKVYRCPECYMTFSPAACEDVAAHERYHDLHLCGRKWTSQWGDLIQEHSLSKSLTGGLPNSAEESGRSSSQRTRTCDFNAEKDRIVQISKSRRSEVQATLEIMSIVNEELHAPMNENFFWSKHCETDGGHESHQANNNGVALVYVRGGRAIGVVTVEFLNDEEQRGRWMVSDTAEIVPKVRPIFRLGISRIWVCRRQRGQNVATRLLDATRLHAIPGMEVAKWELAWSQPSESGGKLAKSYNSVSHEKSGRILIPCYI